MTCRMSWRTGAKANLVVGELWTCSSRKPKSSLTSDMLYVHDMHHMHTVLPDPRCNK